MSVIKIELSSPQLRRHSRLFGAAVRCFLEAIVMVNRAALRTDKSIPPLYSSGVRYAREIAEETFRDIYTVMFHGKGDCAHLAAWRVAELQEAGESATLRCSWMRIKTKTGQTYRLTHVLVRRGDGRVEDPSKLLGMKGSG